MSKQTYCESIGLKVGDKIRVLQQGRTYPVGTIVTLVEADDTTCPYFSDDGGNRKAFSLVNDAMNYLPEGKGWERVAVPDEWIINEGLRDTCPEELREKLIEVVSLEGATRTDYGKNFLFWKHGMGDYRNPFAVSKFRIPAIQGAVETKDKDGWVEWKGGEQPVSDNVEVEIRQRDGQEHAGCAGVFYWSDDGGSCDIIAYRILGAKRPAEPTHDPVNRPSHYMLFPEHQIEFIDVRDVLIERLNGFTPRQIDYWSRAFEYLARAGGKNGVEDIKKAKWYLDRLVTTLAEE